MMTDLDTDIAEALERYAAARHIRRGSPAWSALLLGYQRTPSTFAELLNRELDRMQKNDKRGSQ